MIKRIFLLLIVFSFSVLQTHALEEEVSDITFMNPFEVFEVGELKILRSSMNEMSFEASWLHFYFPTIAYNNEANTSYSTIDFYTTGGHYMGRRSLNSLEKNHLGFRSINFVYQHPELAGAGFFTLNVLQTWTDESLYSGHIEHMNNRAVYVTDILGGGEEAMAIYLEEQELTGSNTAIFYVQFVEYYRVAFSQIPSEPPTPVRPGYTFLGWYRQNGEKYDFIESLNPDYQMEFTTFLYGRWAKSEPIEEDFSVTIPEIINNALSAIGLGGFAGKLLLYFVIAMVLTFTLLHFKISGMVIMFVHLIFISVFLIFGWFPLYVAVILGMAILFGILYYF